MNYNFLVKIILDSWYSKRGLFSALLLSIIFVFLIAPASGASLSTKIIVTAVVILLITIIWILSRRVSVTRKGKVGIVICIYCDKREEEEQFKEDFINTFQKLLKSGSIGRSIQFTNVPNILAKTVVDEDDAQKLRIKCRAHLVLYGRVRARELNGDTIRYFELEGLVSHAPISIENSAKMGQEFRELLLRKVTISKENDLLKFEFTSEWTDLVARYIIGIAAGLSGNLLYSEEMFGSCLNKLDGISSNFHIYEKLKERLPKRLAEINEAKAKIAYEAWVETHDDKYSAELKENLLKIDSDVLDRKSTIYLKSISHFLSDRNVTAAINELNKVHKKNRGAGWNYNMAFLVAYDGDLKSAIRLYRKGSYYNVHPSIYAKLEDFMLYIAENEQDKYQIYFCLGFFNWKIKGDLTQAKADFNRFKERRKSIEYLKEGNLCNEWIIKINETEQ